MDRYERQKMKTRMFYSQDLLTKRGGGFALIWLAATAPKSKIIALKRRDYMSVDIENTCDAIQLHLSKVRRQLSLYLSSQLMYGVVRVYKMQHYYLLSDATTLMARCTTLLQNQGTELIDLKAGPVPRVTNVLSTPDLGTVEMHLTDPDFGTFKIADIVAPDEIPDILPLNMPPRQRLMSSEESQDGSGHELSQERITTPQRLLSPVADQPHTVSNDRISIRDTPVLPVGEIQIPGEVDLPPLTEEGVESLMSTTHEDEDPLKGRRDDKGERSVGSDGKPTHSSTESGPGDLDLEQLAPTEDTPAVVVDPYQMPSPQRKRKRPDSPDVTKISPVQPPASKRKRRDELELDSTLEEGAVTPGRRRPRMLNFADAETQIRKGVLRNYMADTTPIVRSMELPAPNLQKYTNLFHRPGRPGMGKKLLQLWKNNCKTISISMEEAMEPFDEESTRSSSETLQLNGEMDSLDDVRRSRDETPESTRQPVDSGRGEGLRHTLPDESGHLEESVALGQESMERGRDVSREQSRIEAQVTPQVSVMEKSRRTNRSSSVSLDRMWEEEQRSVGHVSAQEASIATAASFQGEPSGLVNILEESREVSDMSVSFITTLGPHEVEPMTSPQHRNIYKTLKHNTRDDKVTTFSTLCPVTMNKKEVAKTFSCMLDFLGKKRIYAVQDEPYAEIYIFSEKP